MTNQNKYKLDFEIDKLTDSILNTISGDSFQTEVSLLRKSDLKTITKSRGWLFNVIRYLASPMLMAVLLVAFAVSSAVATFIENDFGTLTAKALIYNSWWFEFIMFTLAVNFLASIYTRKLYRIEKMAILIFHVGFVVILLGAAITRYVGHEGMMHIREGQQGNTYISFDKWLKIYTNDELKIAKQVNFTTKTRNKFNTSIKFNNNRVNLELTNFISNAIPSVVDHFDGYPVISLVILDSLGRRPVLVRPNMVVPTGISGIGFSQDRLLDVEFLATDTGLVARSLYPVTTRDMSLDVETVIPAKTWFSLVRLVFYNTERVQFAYRNFWPKAKVKMVFSPDASVQGVDVLAFNVNVNGARHEVFVPYSNNESEPIKHEVDGITIGFKYGLKTVEIPFSIKLDKFILQRYPGSDSPSSFMSEVTVIDNEMGIEKPYSIFMNNILKYRGYRFYQSSYDPDEKGTYLSVNNDFWGTSVTYFGYFILIIGIIWSLFARGSRFRSLISKSGAVAVLAIGLLLPISVFAQDIPKPDANHARKFGELQVQDRGGRVKPLSTLANEVLRKLNRSNKFQGLTPEQTYLSMLSFPEHWQHIPVIRIKNKELRSIIGIKGDHASFIDFFDHQAGETYKLIRLVQEAFSLKPSQRTGLHKEVIKTDEKVNIIYMIFSGQIARLFPVEDHPEDRWLSVAEASDISDTLKIQRMSDVYGRYIASVHRATQSGSWTDTQSLLNQLVEYQDKYGSHIMPSKGRIRAEVFMNRIIIFQRLIPFYGLTGLVLLIIVFLELFRRNRISDKTCFILAGLLLIGFLVHTTAIALRWYIAGRAPMSNTYETMIYIAWAAMLAGFLFTKRNRVVLPATALLSTLTLFVANLSWMDPEITNLVPVLKSYWLTIHVAVITASYGFFGLGAILGIIVLLLLSLKSKENKSIIDNQVGSITDISELNLTLGLYLLTIGSFLGAVWANESWGRYWGWDPKETWALITMLVYAFILHMRLIPSFKTPFSFNFGSLIGLGSVLMTYFGVNYYLSGLHSYAGGDHVSIPNWLFLILAAIFSLSFFAWNNNRLVDKEK